MIFRVVVVLVTSLCGHLVMVVAIKTIVTVMVIRTAFIHCPSVLLPSMVQHRGILNSVLPHWHPPSAVARGE